MEGSAGYKDQPWRGMVVDIWLQLAATLNFTFTLGLSSDRKWGARNQVGLILQFFFWFLAFKTLKPIILTDNWDLEWSCGGLGCG